MSGAVQVEQVQELIEDLRAYRTLMRGGHPTICDEAATTLKALLSELASAQREREEAYEACARIAGGVATRCRDLAREGTEQRDLVDKVTDSIVIRVAEEIATAIRQAKGGTNAD